MSHSAPAPGACWKTVATIYSLLSQGLGNRSSSTGDPSGPHDEIAAKAKAKKGLFRYGSCRQERESDSARMHKGLPYALV